MRSKAEAPDSVKPTVPGHLRALGLVLAVRGFTVRIDADLWRLTVTNRAAEPDNPTDPQAVAFGPVKLVQRVHLAPDNDGALCWYWEWSGPDRDGPGEYELLCPVRAIAEADERISRVLALRDEPVGADE